MRHSRPPCTECGSRRLKDSYNGLCAACNDPNRRDHQRKRNEALRSQQKRAHTVLNGDPRGGRAIDGRVPNIICKVCIGLSHRIPKGKLCVCGNTYCETPITPQRELLGSSMGAACAIGGRQ